MCCQNSKFVQMYIRPFSNLAILSLSVFAFLIFHFQFFFFSSHLGSVLLLKPGNPAVACFPQFWWDIKILIMFGYMRVTADQWSAVSLPQANGQREAPESVPGHSQGIVPTLRGILNISWLGWATGLVLTIWGARKPGVKRHISRKPSECGLGRLK
jgi:hypothetical protein